MMLECLILIPFGSPVEPEVNKRQAARVSLISGSRPAVAFTETSLCHCGISKFLSIFSLPIQRIETYLVIFGSNFSMTLAFVSSKNSTEHSARSRILIWRFKGYL